MSHQVETLHAKQLMLEEESVEAGIKRYQDALEKSGEDALPPGLKLMKQSIEPLAAAINDYITKAKEGLASRNAGVVHYLDSFTPEALAWVTSKTCFHFLNTTNTLPMVALRVVAALEASVNIDAIKEVDPKAYKRLTNKLKKEPNPAKKHVLLKAQQQYVGVATISWSREVKLRIGTTLIHLMIESTGLMILQKMSMGANNTPTVLVPTQTTKDWLKNSHAHCELLSPVYLPMVVLPRKWTKPNNGGYLGKALRYQLLKTVNRNYLDELQHHEMPMVYDSINALQETPWMVHKDVLETLVAVWDANGTLGGLPSREDLPLPPVTFDSEAPEPDLLKAWKIEAAKVHGINAQMVSKRIQVSTKVGMAKQFAPFERIYFPHTLDWRGRAYPVPSFLNPQGDDVSKALLTFADGKPLGINGAYWLSVHGANCYGVDKVAFDQRFDWVQDNVEAILDSARNPLDGGRFWCDADSPFMFLAFCFEYLALETHLQAGHTEESFVSNLPVSWDGSCNGLQNFSAMLRDEVGGAAVGLVPSDTPADIYREVAKQSQAAIDFEAATGDAMALKWVGKMNRKLSKQNTMTVPYGVSRFGMTEQLADVFKKLKEKGEDHEVGFDDCRYLAEKNYEAIGKVVIAARLAMDWLMETAKVVAKDGLPIRWTTPSGLVVLQDYRKKIGKAVDFTVAGERYQIMLNITGDELDSRKQSSGISPNFVHSLDAAHMVRTVCYGRESGITHFAMVHDSYGTHAGDADMLNHVLRKAFVDQYSGDVLRDFRDQLSAQVPEELAAKIPELPPMGQLDLQGVMHSEYFFA